MGDSVERPKGWRAWGPGLLLAATGVGAGDLIAAAVAGRRYGVAVLWVVVVCKAVLNEGIARWQLATGESLIAGWARRLPKWVSWYFGAYLVIWSMLVAGALGAACGVAVNALWPDAPGGVATWSAAHAAIAYALVRWGRYEVFETVMKALVGVMFAVVVGCAFLLIPGWSEIMRGLLIPSVPAGSEWFFLGLMGGVGGSATMLCYGYWMRKKGGRGWV
ncbi:MAG: Nramp family divalent metal transporter [Candidatus Synoicihabitans palmerolidicus]|nr:Nramp family divalent metal transporter [Candidatus Synoicihabitans palmerolidicus]